MVCTTKNSFYPVKICSFYKTSQWHRGIIKPSSYSGQPFSGNQGQHHHYTASISTSPCQYSTDQQIPMPKIPVRSIWCSTSTYVWPLLATSWQVSHQLFDPNNGGVLLTGIQSIKVLGIVHGFPVSTSEKASLPMSQLCDKARNGDILWGLHNSLVKIEKLSDPWHFTIFFSGWKGVEVYDASNAEIDIAGNAKHWTNSDYNRGQDSWTVLTIEQTSPSITPLQHSSRSLNASQHTINPYMKEPFVLCTSK